MGEQDMVERVARALDPEAWEEEGAIPVSIHARRQASARHARAAIAALREFDTMFLVEPISAYLNALDPAPPTPADGAELSEQEVAERYISIGQRMVSSREFRVFVNAFLDAALASSSPVREG